MTKSRLWLVSAVLACTACLGDQGKLEIRSIERGLKNGSEPVPFRIAEARGHLALGNVGIALEGFRKAAREDPASVEAMAGIADCYDRMRRFDLSRRYYEMALAIAPREPALLAAFAGSLERQGLNAEAASVRMEIVDLAAAADANASLTEVEETSIQPAGEVRRDLVAAPAVKPPELAAPAPVGQSVTIALPPPRPVQMPGAAAPAARAMAGAPVGKSVTIALPPPRPAPVAAMSTRIPRLERLSLTEVALITGEGLRWKPVEPAPTRMAASRGDVLRVLNAARVSRLAARTRTYLRGFGWRQVAIGDAAEDRAHSLIVYPLGKREEARKLAARLGFTTAQRIGVRQVTVLLGRDAASHPALRSKG